MSLILSKNDFKNISIFENKLMRWDIIENQLIISSNELDIINLHIPLNNYFENTFFYTNSEDIIPVINNLIEENFSLKIGKNFLLLIDGFNKYKIIINTDTQSKSNYLIDEESFANNNFIIELTTHLNFPNNNLISPYIHITNRNKKLTISNPYCKYYEHLKLQCNSDTNINELIPTYIYNYIKKENAKLYFYKNKLVVKINDNLFISIKSDIEFRKDYSNISEIYNILNKKRLVDFSIEKNAIIKTLNSIKNNENVDMHFNSNKLVMLSNQENISLISKIPIKVNLLAEHIYLPIDDITELLDFLNIINKDYLKIKIVDNYIISNGYIYENNSHN